MAVEVESKVESKVEFKILPVEVKEYDCGITHTVKRRPNGEIYFDRMESKIKKLPSTYRSF